MTRRHAGTQSPPDLKRTDKAVLRYLERIARRNRSSLCKSSLPKIAAACDISARQVQISVGRLIAVRLVERVGYDLRHPDKGERGTIYKVLTAEIPGADSLSKREVMRVMRLLVDVCSALHDCIGRLAPLLNPGSCTGKRTAELLRRLDGHVAELAGMGDEKSKRS